MQYREFLSLTDEEIRQIVTDIFEPKKISCIQRHKRGEYISCKIYTEWFWDNESSSQIVADTLELRDPFKNGSSAIHVDFSLDPEDYDILKKFCFAKGIVPWAQDNPYLKKSGQTHKTEHKARS